MDTVSQFMGQCLDVSNTSREVHEHIGMSTWNGPVTESASNDYTNPICSTSRKKRSFRKNQSPDAKPGIGFLMNFWEPPVFNSTTRK